MTNTEPRNWRVTQRGRLIKELMVRANDLDLIFVHTKPGSYSSERFAIMDGRMCLCANEDPILIEHYLFGYRDGRESDDSS